MLYLLYILLGLLIIIAVDIIVTAFWAVHDTLTNRKGDHYLYRDHEVSFIEAFKNYFDDNNNLADLGDIFNN